MAAEGAQVDDVLGLAQNLAHVSTIQHVLMYVDIEAPDADPRDLASPRNITKLSSIGD